MITMTISEVQQNLPELLNCQERIVIERHGKSVAVIISPEDLQRLEALEDAIDSELLRRAIAESTRFVTPEELLNLRPID